MKNLRLIAMMAVHRHLNSTSNSIGGEVPVSLERFEDHVGNEDANAKHLSDDEKNQLEAVAGKDLATTEWAEETFAGKSEFDAVSEKVTEIDGAYIKTINNSSTNAQVSVSFGKSLTPNTLTSSVAVELAEQDSSTKKLSSDGLVTGNQAQAAIDKAVETEKTRAMDAEGALTTAVTTADGKAVDAQTAVNNLKTLVGELPDGARVTNVVDYVDEKVKDLGDTVDAALDEKQDNLTAGANITIEGNVISASGGAERVYNKFVVVGVYGQSNAVGYDESPLTKYDIPVDANRVKQYSDSLKPLTFCAENIQNMNTVSPRSGTEGAMTTERAADAYTIEGRTTYTMTKGIHLPLANLICSVIPDDYGVIIVPCGNGGKAISNFVPNTNDYNTFKSHIKSAMALNADNVFAGIVWCQGESDAGSTAAATYKEKFESIINTLHTDINLNPKQMPKVSNAKEYWFAYEWPFAYKQRDSKGILNVQREVLGAANYVEIPDETPANTTNYCASNPGDHFGKDSFRKVIAPRVFAKMQEACMFQNVEFYGIDSEEIAELETTVEKHSKEIEESEAKVQKHKDFINVLIDKINELAAKHPGEVDPVVITYDVTKSCALSQYGSGDVAGLTTTATSISMNNGGGWRATLFDENITHFECTVATTVGNTNSIAFVIAEDPNEPGSGCGFFLNAVQNNKLGYVSSTENGFNTTTPSDSWAGHTVSAGDKVTIDVSGDNVKVVLTNNENNYTIFDGSVSGGLGGKTRFSKPRIGVFGSWTKNGTISLTDVVMTSSHI